MENKVQWVALEGDAQFLRSMVWATLFSETSLLVACERGP
jgi:hypothetical protein